MIWRLKRFWIQFWMKFAGRSRLGRLASRLVTLFGPRMDEREVLASWTPKGYIAPTAWIEHSSLQLGTHVFIGDDVRIYDKRWPNTTSGKVEICDRVFLYPETFIRTGMGATVTLGADTHIQPRCWFTAFLSDIIIGQNVEIAPCCAFYSFDHGYALGRLIQKQPLQSKGSITIGDGAWIGHGVTVLAGSKIGAGAVVSAGSVVASSIPENAIAAGAPARVISFRGES